MRKWLLKIVLLLICLSLAGLGAIGPVNAAGDVGYKDFTYGSERSPTAEKPESKLWFHDGLWWGVLYNRLTHQYEIFKFNWAAQTWATTGMPVDNRTFSHQDALSAGSSLFIASAAVPGALNQTDTNAYVSIYTYDSINRVYQAGSVTAVWNRSVETIVIDQDTTGVLWVTFTDEAVPGQRSVYVRHTQGTLTNWKTAYVLPVSGAANLNLDDISTLVAYSGKIGVLWSNQTDNAVYFATHEDGDPDSTWSLNTAVSGPKWADDHLNIKSLQADPSGQVFAVVKTSLNDVNPPTSQQPEILLLMLDNNGSWSQRIVARVVDNHTRPILLLDSENRVIYVFMTLQYANQTSGAIYYKSVSLDDPGMQFEQGVGIPFIEYADSTHINNATSTKQPLNGTTDLLVIASDDSTQFYFHNAIDLPGPPPPPVFNVYLPLILK